MPETIIFSLFLSVRVKMLRITRQQLQASRASYQSINPLTPNDLYRRRAVSPLKTKIPGKNMREKPTNTTIIHSVY
jgi:hypothetical protein